MFQILENSSRIDSTIDLGEQRCYMLYLMGWENSTQLTKKWGCHAENPSFWGILRTIIGYFNSNILTVI